MFVGEGVNDVSTMQVADIAIAMNSGTDACKNAASVIIMNEKLGGIVDLIAHG